MSHSLLRPTALNAFIEGFAGEAMVSLHLMMAGFKGRRLDKSYQQRHDIIRHFRAWLNEWTHTQEGCLHWAAPLCSSFVILCRGPSGRREDNSWWGNEEKDFVRLGNKIMVQPLKPWNLILKSHVEFLDRDLSFP